MSEGNTSGLAMCPVAETRISIWIPLFTVSSSSKDLIASP